MRVNLFFKRIFDVFFSIVGIVICIPFFIIISIIIKVSSKGPVLFKQTRVGKNHKNFKILKFRTMITDAQKKGLSITVGEDARITSAGRFLRKTRLDELPQLLNILIGDMSFVGPRPEVPEYVEFYNEEQRKILNIRPGLTDYASICFKNESEILANSHDPQKEYIENIMPLKIKYNMKYINKINVVHDVKIISLTFWAVMGGKVEIRI